MYFFLYTYLYGDFLTIFNVYNDFMDKVIDGIDLSGQKTLHG